MFALLRNFSKIVSAVEASPAEMLGSELAQSLDEYSRAIELIQGQNWAMAELELRRCLEIIDKAGHYGESSYNFILSRLALVQRAQSKYSQCEKSLEEVVKNYKKNEAKYPERLEKAYETLFQQYLSSNISKALKLGEYFLQENNWSTLRRSYQKDVKFYFGVNFTQTALILHGQYYAQAKKELYDCLKLNPGGNTCFVFHNLACAQWLHARKFAEVDTSSLSLSLQEEHKQATTDFIECIPNFQKAIQLFEGFPDTFSIESEVNLKNKLTGLSLTNLAEIYFEKLEPEVSAKQEGIKWLKGALKFYEELDKNNIGRALTLIGIFLSSKNNKLHAEGLFRNAIDILKNVRFTQKNDYNQIFALEAFGSMLKTIEKRASEGEQLHLKAKEIALSLPFWYERAIYLHIPTWTI